MSNGVLLERQNKAIIIIIIIIIIISAHRLPTQHGSQRPLWCCRGRRPKNTHCQQNYAAWGRTDEAHGRGTPSRQQVGVAKGHT